MQLNNVYVGVTGRGWDASSTDMLATGGYQGGDSDMLDTNLQDAANTGRNKSDQRATLSFVAVRQEYKGEKLEKEIRTFETEKIATSQNLKLFEEPNGTYIHS